MLQTALRGKDLYHVPDRAGRDPKVLILFLSKCEIQPIFLPILIYNHFGWNARTCLMKGGVRGWSKTDCFLATPSSSQPSPTLLVPELAASSKSILPQNWLVGRALRYITPLLSLSGETRRVSKGGYKSPTVAAKSLPSWATTMRVYGYCLPSTLMLFIHT